MNPQGVVAEAELLSNCSAVGVEDFNSLISLVQLASCCCHFIYDSSTDFVDEPMMSESISIGHLQRGYPHPYDTRL